MGAGVGGGGGRGDLKFASGGKGYHAAEATLCTVGFESVSRSCLMFRQ